MTDVFRRLEKNLTRQSEPTADPVKRAHTTQADAPGGKRVVGGRSLAQKTWGEQIRTFRRHRMLKQDALAAMLDVDQASVSRWECDRGIPSDRVQRMLRALIRSVRMPDQLLKYSVLSSQSPVLLADSTCTIWAASRSYSEAQGVAQSDIVGMTTHPQFTESIERVFNSTTAQGFYKGEIASVRYTDRTNTLSGVRGVPVEVLWLPVFLSDGTVLKRTERVLLTEEAFARNPYVANPVVTPLDDIFEIER